MVIALSRKAVGQHIGKPKTDYRSAEIPLLPLVQDMLAKYKKQFPEVIPAGDKPGDGWVFRGERLAKPLDLDNLSRRHIPDLSNGAWFGFIRFGEVLRLVWRNSTPVQKSLN
jgi:hypothetical protein